MSDKTITAFQKTVLLKWFELGRNATSRELADELNSKEGNVSKAMDVLQEFGPCSTMWWTPYKSNQRIFNVHSPDKCAGQPCPVHNVTDHHMKEWPQHYREDRRITERLCPHGVGHPDPDDMMAKGPHSIHGCDGCCCAPKIALSKETKELVREIIGLKKKKKVKTDEPEILE